MAEARRSLIGELVRQILSSERLRLEYLALEGGVGIFGATMIQADIDKALEAIDNADTVGMVRMLQELKGHK